jgi:uncharacterized protein YfaS (alpha-2-macroglobulin family)
MIPRRLLHVTLALLVVLTLACLGAAVAATQPESRASAGKALKNGNWKDAYDMLSKLALDPQDDPARVTEDFNSAIACLQRLGRVNEVDAFREKVIVAHAKNWRLLWTAAQSYQTVEWYGFMIAGQFERGGHRGGDGKQVSAMQRDRVRSLQLFEQAAKQLAESKDKVAADHFWASFADTLMNTRQGGGAWQLQFLSDLTKLPDYDEMEQFYGRGRRGGFGGGFVSDSAQGAPVDEAGNPVYHKIPPSWEAAKTDGERWRWCLVQLSETSADNAARAQQMLARFLQGQFDVGTLQQFGGLLPRKGGPDEKDESGPYAVSTLAEDETIAQLATGIKRFKLPDEFNFIKIYKDLVAGGRANYAVEAGDALPAIFEDRQQYPRAAELWTQQIRAHGPGNNNWRQARLEQIVGNWGMFEQTQTNPAGRELELPFVFRNGTRVTFQAWSIDVPKLLKDVKGYIKSKPQQFDWQRLDIENLGHRLVTLNQREYLKEKAADWALDLKPREKHYDRRLTVKAPIQKAGAYFIEAKVEGGNTTRVIAWVADTAIVKKPVDGGSYCYVADAVTGAPVAGASVEFFGWRQRHVKDRQFAVDVTEETKTTGDAGAVRFTGQVDNSGGYQYLITAATADGRLAHLGYSNIWQGSYEGADSPYNQRKIFTITDRPVYRPGQTVKFKFWVNQAKYDQDGKSVFAGQQFTVVVNNPRGDKMLEQTFTADDFGGLNGELALDKEATLGTYSLQILNMGGGSFRVEEYKKPEFEVKVDAPTEPVQLGDRIAATVKCNYYFGAPVTSAKVKYKVLRSVHDARWFPKARWDWMYGPGYWWFAPDRVWFPGFREWGCFAPYPWWYDQRMQQPEVVLQNEVPVGKDGTVKIEIDTAVAKAIHGDQDHKYEITAEVTDESRRTIVGTGSVTVAREPFKVYVWTEQGYYRAGDVIEANFQAQTLDQKPVKGSGVLKLFKIGYDDQKKPIEKEVGNWELATNEEGAARHPFKAAEPGQYRLSYTVTDEKKHSVEGGYLTVVTGDNFDGGNFRFNDVELIPDKKDYQPGEKVRLMINTNRQGGTVALFLRPVNGMYLPPKLIKLDGKSTVQEIEVSKKDMPNFFVEAVTVADGRVYTETREIVVPPEKRVVDVQVTPSKEKYKPGEKATVKVKLTDPTGEPIVGSTVVSLYDKSVEYISGGSNVEEIKAFFWKWRRSHNPQTEATLGRYGQPAYRPGETTMSFIGRFGGLVALLDDELRAVARISEESEFEGGMAVRGAGGEGQGQGFGRGRRMDAALRATSAMAPGVPMAAAMKSEQQVGQKAAAGGFAADAADAGPSQAELVAPTVRQNFADTALWVANLTTDKTGTAEVSLDMPENLTTWKARVWSMSDGTRVGEGSAEVTTYKNLLVRLQAPRFFVQKDEVVLSANVHNYLKTAKDVRVELVLQGGTLAGVDVPDSVSKSNPGGNGLHYVQTVKVEAGGERRVDWRVKVQQPGNATVRMIAQTDEESDAMQMSFPVYIHGMLKTDSFSGAIRPQENTASITLRIPQERLPEQSRLEIRYSPSVAAAMVDALPYLANYPYGCTEQTLNRFVPTVITRKTLLDMGLNLKDVAFKRSNLNAQEIGDDPKRAADWKRAQGDNYNPVFDEAKLEDMITEGVTKLSNQQIEDGGWGWFSGFGESSYAHTTAVVVHGLQLARECDVKLPDGMLERGVEWLKRYEAQQVQLLKNHEANVRPSKASADDLDAFAYMVLADANLQNKAMLEYLYRDRNNLAVYSKAVYGLALHKQGHADKLTMILRNIAQFLVEDDENQTAYLKLPEGNVWWYWHGNDIEANAFYLKLLSKTDPKGQVASRLSKYVINNRKHATYWNSTRDTAYSIEALASFVKASGEDKPDMTLQVLIDGKKHKEVRITAENFFSFDNKLVLEGGDALPAGEHKVEFVKTGKGPLYFNAYATNFTLEDPIRKAGLEIKVQRKFYKLVPVDKTIKAEGSRGQAVDQKVEKFERQVLEDGDTLKSGDRVEVEMEIDSKNDYEYVLFEDMKASGFEPVDTQSGYNGNDLGAYMELRDERVCFFTRALARGKHSVSYQLRAEIPGKFSALPTRASAMYAPELKANSDENKLNIVD